MDDAITFTPKMVKALREAYNKAKQEQAISFMFMDKEILTTYAKYMLEYLSNEMGGK
jgi:hypothetical protein